MISGPVVRPIPTTGRSLRTGISKRCGRMENMKYDCLR